MRKTAAILLVLSILFLSAAAAGESLRYGMSGDEVARLQQSLIEKGFLKGSADGVFGYKTEKAVLEFQQKNKLTADGIAGDRTQALLYSDSGKGRNPGFFSDDYTKITAASEEGRIRTLQKALISLNYLDSAADGIYGSMTEKAVAAFQKEHKLTKDGIAGKQTLKAIEKALADGFRHQSALDAAEPLDGVDGKGIAPARDEIQLLNWYTDIKPRLKSNAKLTVYDPASGLSWTLKVYSRGRHCDAEPLTLKDTQIMMKAFGDKHTWGPKGVYVCLPDGRWTIGATHNVPHLDNHLKDNGFDGVLCVHFFRDMEECSRLDPQYGVQNQKTIRSLWKKVSGEILD